MRKSERMVLWCGLMLTGLFFHAGAAVTEKWVLSGQSNANRLLSGSNIQSVCIPMMQAESISVNFTGSAVDGQSIRGWNQGTSSWTVLTQNLYSTGVPTDVFIWYQGEANGLNDPMSSDTYLDSLKSLVERVRLAGHNPEMTIVICQLGDITVDTYGGYSLAYPPIRDAQQRFVAQDSNAVLMPNIGRSLADIVHLSDSSRKDLAVGIGKALLNFRHGKKLNWPGPVLDAAVKNGTNGIVAHFAEVQKLSGIMGTDFALADPDSLNPCIAVLDSGNTLASLRFQRPVKLPAKLIYGTGNNPRALLRDEAGNRAPAVRVTVTEGSLADQLSYAPNGSSSAISTGNTSVMTSKAINVDRSEMVCSPVPFNPTLHIRLPYKAGHQGEYRIRIYDVSGKAVKEICAANSTRSITWDGRNTDGRLLSSGTYVIRLSYAGRTYQTRAVLLK